MRRVPAHCDLGSGASRDPLPGELRCWYNATGPGAFGLLSYLDVPVYQPVTPLPGTHVVGIPGLPAPREGESYEGWEWRLLKTQFGADVQTVRREMELLDPVVASKAMRLEALLRAEGIPFRRRETWRAPERQAWIFQQGRARPGPIATSTLTSWHCRVDRLGRPAGRALDYDVPGSRMARFHALAAQAGLQSYGADSNDPGHVYYVGTEFLTPMELQIMRTVPRVPHVTLETGRPDGEPPVPGGLRWHQERERAFLAEPAVGVPALMPSVPAAPRTMTRPPEPAAPPAPAPTPRGRRP
jgi:hypothetical protein